MKINIWTVDITLEDGSYLQRAYWCFTVEEAFKHAEKDYPNWQSLGCRAGDWT